MLTGTPFIPETITVHLGTPDSAAPNVTLDFASYVKNGRKMHSEPISMP